MYMSKYTIRKNAKGQYYWTLSAQNGQTIIQSDVHKSKESALKALKQCQELAADAEIDDQTCKTPKNIWIEGIKDGEITDFDNFAVEGFTKYIRDDACVLKNAKNRTQNDLSVNDRTQLREALKYYKPKIEGKNINARAMFLTAQAHLKLLDGIEGLRFDENDLPDNLPQDYAKGGNHMLDAVMKLMEG